MVDFKVQILSWYLPDESDETFEKSVGTVLSHLRFKPGTSWIKFMHYFLSQHVQLQLCIFTIYIFWAGTVKKVESQRPDEID
jgi:hypothetical protein